MVKISSIVTSESQANEVNLSKEFEVERAVDDDEQVEVRQVEVEHVKKEFEQAWKVEWVDDDEQVEIEQVEEYHEQVWDVEQANDDNEYVVPWINLVE